jgi:hypothetical protein
VPSPVANGAPVAWDDLYDRLPPDSRARLLAAAAATGTVPAEQVPHPPAAPPPHLLHRLLAGDGLDDLPPLTPSDQSDLPAELDPQQRAAVELALHTPDVALVQGLPGTGKSYVAATTAALAARRGERVLLVAPDAAALDRVLEMVADRPEVCPLRCVSRDEVETDLPPAAAACTIASQTRRLTEQAREQARTKVEAAIAACRRRDAEAAVYDHLLDLAEQHHRLTGRRAELESAAPDADAVRIEGDLAARRADADRAREASRALAPTLAEVRPLAAARAVGRWWTPVWWRARFAGDVAGRLADLETKDKQAVADAAAAAAEIERLTEKRAEHDRRRAAERADQLAAVERELALVEDKWQQALRQLPDAGPRPAALSPDAAAAARDAWAKDRDADRRDLEFAQAWADGLEPLLEALPGRLLEAVNLVAATPAALTADRHFGDGRRGAFDLLLVEEAHAISDGDLLAAARRARRWVLIGSGAGRGAPQIGPPSRGGPSGAARLAAPTPAFDRLWQTLHCDPWARSADRVVCRLRPVRPDRRLAREPVADRPDVELGIDTPPGGGPELAEVTFPAATPIAQAVAYVFKELGELPACGHITLALGSPAANGDAADLGGGVRAIIGDGPDGWAVCAIEFDPNAGWDRERAAAWVRRHVVRHGPARTVRLETPHRMAAGLANFVSDLLGFSPPLPGVAGEGGEVEFLPVPGVGRNGHGAGLEIDLADARQRGQLPPELADLPTRGVVNLAEARAVVWLLDQHAGEAAAVLALTAAQAALIRRLAGPRPGLVIGVPPVLRQREAGTVIISLVRSHTHRAVPFGDEPDWLSLALARGRRRLILVGDPGTLARRAQWDGPLDHLAATAARRERTLVEHLVGYVHGRGRFPGAFRLCAGSAP